MTARTGSAPLLRLAALSSSSFGSIAAHQSSLPRRRTIERLVTSSSLPNKPISNPHTLRTLASVRPEPISELWFTTSFPAGAQVYSQGTVYSVVGPQNPQDGRDHGKPDERTLKLGKTLRRLSPLLPNILTTPLPQDLLSPNISLHLFPSTHPHLPVVKGRVPFRAALWTAPVAWGSLPIMRNNKLQVLSEKIVRTGYVSAPIVVDPAHDQFEEEKLVVRWRTEPDNATSRDSADNQSLSSSSENGSVNRGLSTLLGGTQPIFSGNLNEPFSGIFIFSFDKDGCIASQTIEHADENQSCDKTSRVVTLTDWLLGKAKWNRPEDGIIVPGLAMRRCRAWIRKHDEFKQGHRWRNRYE